MNFSCTSGIPLSWEKHSHINPLLFSFLCCVYRVDCPPWIQNAPGVASPRERLHSQSSRSVINKFATRWLQLFVWLRECYSLYIFLHMHRRTYIFIYTHRLRMYRGLQRRNDSRNSAFRQIKFEASLRREKTFVSRKLKKIIFILSPTLTWM